MLNDEQAERFRAKIKAGTMTWEDTADMFQASDVGAAALAARDLTKGQLMLRLQARFNHDLAALNTWVQAAYASMPAEWQR